MKHWQRLLLATGIIVLMHGVLLAAVCWELLRMDNPTGFFSRGIIAMQGFATAICMAFLFTDIIKPNASHH